MLVDVEDYDLVRKLKCGLKLSAVVENGDGLPLMTLGNLQLFSKSPVHKSSSQLLSAMGQDDASDLGAYIQWKSTKFSGV